MRCAKCSVYLVWWVLGQEDAGLSKAVQHSSLCPLQFHFLDKWQRGGGVTAISHPQVSSRLLLWV